MNCQSYGVRCIRLISILRNRGMDEIRRRSGRDSLIDGCRTVNDSSPQRLGPLSSMCSRYVPDLIAEMPAQAMTSITSPLVSRPCSCASDRRPVSKPSYFSTTFHMPDVSTRKTALTEPIVRRVIVVLSHQLRSVAIDLRYASTMRAANGCCSPYTPMFTALPVILAKTQCPFMIRALLPLVAWASCPLPKR